MTNFGASFKKARESQGISLDQIAADTRISSRFLVAIESEEFHLLPGGIFNRGFVRAYAERVGLDPDQAVADYERLAEVREPAVEAISTPDPQPTKRERNLYPIALGALALVIIIFYIVTRESNRTPQTATASPPPVVTQPAAQPSAQPAAQPSAQPPVVAQPAQ